jgi:hypothetical protein
VKITERRRAQTGAVLAALFAATGLAFLLWPGGLLRGLDAWSRALGLAGGAPAGGGFWTVLAVAYMYVVTVLAWGIRRHPAEPLYPRLLTHAKLASAALSLALFALVTPHLALLANGLVDGALGVLALELWRSCRAGPEPARGGP